MLPVIAGVGKNTNTGSNAIALVRGSRNSLHQHRQHYPAGDV
jgi:hypothetical protein